MLSVSLRCDGTYANTVARRDAFSLLTEGRDLSPPRLSQQTFVTSPTSAFNAA